MDGFQSLVDIEEVRRQVESLGHDLPAHQIEEALNAVLTDPLSTTHRLSTGRSTKISCQGSRLNASARGQKTNQSASNDLDRLTSRLDKLEAKLSVLSSRQTSPAAPPLYSSNKSQPQISSPSFTHRRAANPRSIYNAESRASEVYSNRPLQHGGGGTQAGPGFQTPTATGAQQTSLASHQTSISSLDSSDTDLDLLMRYLKDLTGASNSSSAASLTGDASSRRSCNEGAQSCEESFSSRLVDSESETAAVYPDTIPVDKCDNQNKGIRSLEDEDSLPHFQTPHRHRGKIKTDPVTRYHELKEVWARDDFLRNGGDQRTSRRRAEGYRELFAALHASLP